MSKRQTYATQMTFLKEELKKINDVCDGLIKENKQLKDILYYSEQWRQAYRKGKLAMYAMGGVVADAAMKHLPSSEAALERAAIKALGETTGWIELKHYVSLHQKHTMVIDALKLILINHPEQCEHIHNGWLAIEQAEKGIEP